MTRGQNLKGTNMSTLSSWLFAFLCKMDSVFLALNCQLFVYAGNKSIKIVRLLVNTNQENFLNVIRINPNGKILLILFCSLFSVNIDNVDTAQWAFTCSKLTIETLEQGVKYVQS